MRPELTLQDALDLGQELSRDETASDTALVGNHYENQPTSRQTYHPLNCARQDLQFFDPRHVLMLGWPQVDRAVAVEEGRWCRQTLQGCSATSR